MPEPPAPPASRKMTAPAATPPATAPSAVTAGLAPSTMMAVTAPVAAPVEKPTTSGLPRGYYEIGRASCRERV